MHSSNRDFFYSSFVLGRLLVVVVVYSMKIYTVLYDVCCVIRPVYRLSIYIPLPAESFISNRFLFIRMLLSPFWSCCLFCIFLFFGFVIHHVCRCRRVAYMNPRALFQNNEFEQVYCSSELFDWSIHFHASYANVQIDYIWLAEMMLPGFGRSGLSLVVPSSVHACHAILVVTSKEMMVRVSSSYCVRC